MYPLIIILPDILLPALSNPNSNLRGIQQTVKTVLQATRKPLVNTQPERFAVSDRNLLPSTSFLVNAARASLIWYTQYKLGTLHSKNWLPRFRPAPPTNSSSLFQPSSITSNISRYTSNLATRETQRFDRRKIEGWFTWLSFSLSLSICSFLLPSTGSPRIFSFFFSHWKATASPVPFSGLLLSVSPPATPLVPEHQQLVKGEIVNISRPWPRRGESAHNGETALLAFQNGIYRK